MKEKIRQRCLEQVVKTCQRLRPTELFENKQEFELATAERNMALEACFPHITVEAVARAIIRGEHSVCTSLADHGQYRDLYGTTMMVLENIWRKATDQFQVRRKLFLEERLRRINAAEQKAKEEEALAVAKAAEASLVKLVPEVRVETPEVLPPETDSGLGTLKKMFSWMRLL